jgi:hypothetical protein
MKCWQLSTKCSNSAFSARASRLNDYSCTVRSSENIYAAAKHIWRRSGKRKDRMKLGLSPKLIGGAQEKGKTG